MTDEPANQAEQSASTEASAEAPTLEQVLACPHLPSLPTVAIEVLELTRDRDVMLREISRVVQNDQALAAKILKTVNSSYYALAKPCPTISRALTYLGLSTVKSLVLGFSLVELTSCPVGGFNLTDYWRRCLYAAAAARRAARETGICDPEEAFIAALMQDVGMFAMSMAAPDRYRGVFAEAGTDHRRLPGLEKQSFGYSHTHVGAQLGERWRLPEDIVAAIQHHHDPQPGQYAEVVRIVNLGFEVSNTFALESPTAALSRIQRNASEWFGMSHEQLSDLIRGIQEDASELARLFEVSTGAAPDVNALLSAAEEAAMEHQFAVREEHETLRRSNDELAKQAVTDALTGAGNRKKFDADLAERFEQAKAFKGSVGLIMCDADKFKILNDDYGHQVGDAVLVQLARRLAETVRDGDIVCRYGGEEFAVILPGGSIKDVAVIAENIRAAVESPDFDLTDAPGDAESVSVTVSLGVSVHEPSTAHVLATPALLIKAADKALYNAKESGRNCVRVFRVSPRAEAA
jgi:diguanylate cyclase (GGDEF)-like protein/putative nucleotidyltransferase with HDIG domain